MGAGMMKKERNARAPGIRKGRKGSDVKRLFDPNPGLRSKVEWRRILSGLVETLSVFSRVEFEPTSWLIRDDDPAGNACICNCVNIRGSVNAALQLDACGVVCITINLGEAVWASCDLLLFASGRRVCGPDKADLVFLSYGEVGWVSKGWMVDENGEWESHITDAWWRTA
jgi:hypothetical protein